MSSSRFLLVALAASATLCALPALAHVSLETPEAPRGKSYKAVIKVPHGCEGAATHTVRVEVPEGFIGAKPMPKAGWTLKTERGAYARSYAYYHGPLSEGVKAIEWADGSLPDDQYDEFVAAGFVAKELDPGTSLYFKVVQLCDKGELRWVEVPEKGMDPHDLAAPAAVLRIADSGAADAHGHHHHKHGSSAKADEGGSAGDSGAAGSASDAGAAGSASIGTLAIEGAWTRATADGAKVGAGYLTIRNGGKDADTLVAVETAVAGKSEIHDMTMSDEGVMRMRRMADGVEIPAGGSVELKPGGMHLMFMELKQAIAEGTPLAVTLRFKSGASGEVRFPVRPLGGADGRHDHGKPDTSKPDHGHHDHGDHKH